MITTYEVIVVERQNCDTHTISTQQLDFLGNCQCRLNIVTLFRALLIINGVFWGMYRTFEFDNDYCILNIIIPLRITYPYSGIFVLYLTN